jgi:hypothetical protein
MNDFLSFEITDWMQEELHLKEGSLVLYAILFSAGKGAPVKIENIHCRTFYNLCDEDLYKVHERLVFGGYLEPIAQKGYKPVRDLDQIKANKLHWDEVQKNIIRI